MPLSKAQARNPRRLAGRGVFVHSAFWSVTTPETDPCRGWRLSPERKPLTLPGVRPRKERAHLPVSATGSLCREYRSTVKRQRSAAIQQP